MWKRKNVQYTVSLKEENFSLQASSPFEGVAKGRARAAREKDTRARFLAVASLAINGELACMLL